MHVLLLGASRHIGHDVALRLLARGDICTLLVRNTSSLDSDSIIQDHVKQGSARLVKGDALVQSDVRAAWETAGQGSSTGTPELIFFGIGGVPSFSLTKGFLVSPPNLTSLSMLILLRVIEPAVSPKTSAPPPRLVVITSNGLTHDTHTQLPFALRVFYSSMLDQPHADKYALEAVSAYGAGWGSSVSKERALDISEDVKKKNDQLLDSPETATGGWRSTLSEGFLGETNLVLVRPSLLTDGPCEADAIDPPAPGEVSKAYRVDHQLKKAWTIRRSDVAHFVVEGVVGNWAKWGGQCVSVSY